ncbi:hypothetical protein [Clostridium lacusfryxellense]|uniref:hypothetical protein n=1 Tax=Clostridium lacusfryxellense TaxID=205328 RepID=UPI001C0B3DA9|nr:hypothetical protein [Clostridium lacusfryxellense]MBU3112987.1 hypothetical protein [Clostridium lacusfryxellense]
MYYNAKLNLSKGKDKVSKEILRLTLNDKRRIDVVSVFYNSSDILLETIISFANKNKSILYITNEKEQRTDIRYFINEFSNMSGYVYSDVIDYGSRKDYIYICNHNDALRLQGEFDLVIYNDISSFPQYNKEQIKKILLKMCKAEGIAIAYCVEDVFSLGNTIIFPLKDTNTPIIEPRIITTRINLSMDIPLVVYEYLNWSIISNRKVVIFTPDAEKATAVFEYLSLLKERLSENIYLFIAGKSDDYIKLKFMSREKGIMVTNDFKESSVEFHSIDVIVYFADDVKFNHKQLLCLSSKVGRYESEDRGEAIFLANAETDEMDEAKSIARKFNEKAWERGLLNI